MTLRTFEYTCGRRQNRFQLDDRLAVEVAVPRTLPTLDDPRRAIAEAVANPIASSKLRDIATRGKKVAVIVTDITRKIPGDLMLAAILDELALGGVPDRDVTIVIATGLHRPNTPEEIVRMLGPEAAARIRVVNHVATDPDAIVDLGPTANGIPMTLNRIAMEADVRIVTGCIEPHKLAGFSGGVKCMSVGIAGFATIAHTHAREMNDHPTCRLGVIEGNLFREFLNEVAMTAGLDFIVNVVQDPTGKLVRAVAGHPIKAFEAGVETARAQAVVEIERSADLVVAIPGYPKEQNVYQASRAMNTVIFGPEPVLNRGGDIIVPATCDDGFGDRGIFDALSAVPSHKELLANFRRDGFPPGGAPVAYKLANIMEFGDIWFTDCRIPAKTLEAVHCRSASTVQKAIDRILEVKSPRSVLVMPYATTTIPHIRPSR
ncbi:MAG: nickel-dependent lactate racemase [Holophaga sp.]|nr:nickel-dependent lactate racemase [Holophaga sp.]